MMNLYVLSAISKLVAAVAVVFSLYLLIRGHNHPGGGFAAGLVTSSGMALLAVSSGLDNTMKLFSKIAKVVFPFSLLILISGVTGMLASGHFLKQYHATVQFNESASFVVSTTLMFDLGVYAGVIGTVWLMMNAFWDIPE